MKAASQSKRVYRGILLLAAAAVLLYIARILIIVLRLLFCLATLLVCVLVLRPESYQFVPSYDALFDTHQQQKVESRNLIVPNILHQTYKTQDIPEAWKNAQSYCKELHQDYQYIFWTDDSARAFVAANYTWFLGTYDRYPHNIQRVDALRYLLLHHFGGVYMDLDVGCRGWRLDRLRQYPMVLPTTDPVGFSNDVMVSTPQHPLLEQMVHALQHWNHIYGTKYPTVMFSTGPMFLSIQYMLYRLRWPWQSPPGKNAERGGFTHREGFAANVYVSNRRALVGVGVGKLQSADSGTVAADRVMIGGRASRADVAHTLFDRPGTRSTLEDTQGMVKQHVLGVSQAGRERKLRSGGSSGPENGSLAHAGERGSPSQVDTPGSRPVDGSKSRAGEKAGVQGAETFEYDAGDVWALPDALYGHNWKSFFVHYPGNSWHGFDSSVVFWLYHHLNVVLVEVGMVLGLVVTAYVMFSRHCEGRRNRAMHKQY